MRYWCRGLHVPFLVLGCIAGGKSNVGCPEHGYCHGHGICTYVAESGFSSYCTCYEGWGGGDYAKLYHGIAADCSERSCPLGKAWSWISNDGTATAAHSIKECSGVGDCDRRTGECLCPDGFLGANCGRSSCPNGCSGHGRCLSIDHLSVTPDSLPLTDASILYGEWDGKMLYRCVCDSQWAVGLGENETQATEWFGAGCSLRRCPSGDNPDTIDNETNGFGVRCSLDTHDGTNGIDGNLCYNECSGKGTCDYTHGLCTCFDGYGGHNCALRIQ